jgi:hypothetical protein
MAKPVGHRSCDYTTPRPAPPSGQLTARVEPFSPWQLLVEDRRVELDPPLSLDGLSSAARIPKATLYNWLRHPEGAPPRKRYTATVNTRLAKALRLPVERLAAAYDASRAKFAPRAPGSELDALSRFTDAVRSSRRTAWTRQSILDLADDIASGKR